MRRSGSASCILRPKNSLSAEDLQRLATEAPTTTVLTVDKLPPYCADRLYILGELQVHSNSISFLCDIGSESERGDSANDDSSSSPPAFPPSIILYLLWKNGTYPTPRSFADGPLSEGVRRCLLANGDEAPRDDELDVARAASRSSPYSPRRRHTTTTSIAGKEKMRNKYDPLPSLGASAANAENDGSDKIGSSGSDISRHNDPGPKVEDDGNGNSDAFGDNDGPRKDTDGSRIHGHKQPQHRENEQLTRIYVVVDRISPSEVDNNDLGELPNFPDLGSTSSFNLNAGIQPVRESPQGQSAHQHPKQQHQQDQPAKHKSQTKEQRERQQLVQHNNEIQTAEQLARAVASSRFLRNRIDGISVGITSDARAAPGLEACMDAVMRGAKERRLAARDGSVLNTKRNKERTTQDAGEDYCGGDEKKEHYLRRGRSLNRLREASPERSPVAIVAMQPDDLEGADHHHHHSHSHHSHAHSDDDDDDDADVINPKILQCRVSTEWNGKGECKSFTDRAMGDWRRAWYGEGTMGISGGGNDCRNGVGGNGNAGRSNNGRAIRPKVPRISSRGREEKADEECDYADEPISTAMAVVFLAMMAAYVWSSYGDLIMSFLFV